METGALKRINVRVGPVHKCLTAAAEVCAQGNRIVLDDDGSFILSKKTGETTPIHKKGSTYVTRVRVLRPDTILKPAPKLIAPVDEAANSGQPGFHRPAPL